MRKTKRQEKLDKRPINQDSFFAEWPEAGLVAMSSPYDPKPSVKVSDGRIVEMDGKSIEEFDSIELFISRNSINLDLVIYAMDLPSRDIARMIVDVNVPREEVISITTAITPAKMLEVLRCMNTVEIMMGQMKMRRREKPANQAHVTNLSDNPALLAADAAEAAARGFAELETTCAVSRFAPWNAISIMVGGLAAAPGIMTQCSMEESLEVKMGMKGITTYAETISFYGSEKAMDDGDDTPWSKGFLTAAYASRGIKMRCTSGTGSEVLMGYANKKSMLYLELLCVFMARGCGIQGIQNGSISCIGITSAVPEGFLAMAAENLAVSLLDMEVASGNDQTFTYSDIRRTGKLLMQMLPGTDFITSGYSAVPNAEDIFAGSNTDCDDYDDWYMIQRDMRVDGGIEPITEETAINARNRGARAIQAVFEELGFPEITDEEVEAAIYAYSSEEMPARNQAHDLAAANQFFEKGYNGVDIARALYEKGYDDVADNILEMMKARISGDYLQPAAIFDKDNKINSGYNHPNVYAGPGTGYRVDGERWRKLSEKNTAIIPEDILETQRNISEEIGNYQLVSQGTSIAEDADIVIGISPGFCDYRIGVENCKVQLNVLKAIVDEINNCNCTYKMVKFYDTDDLSEIAKRASEYSRAKISIGIQINGRVYICDARQSNEQMRGFFNMVMSSPEDYRAIGEIASRYVKDSDAKNLFIKPSRGISEYQLRMMKLCVDETNLLRPDKSPEWVEMQLQ